MKKEIVLIVISVLVLTIMPQFASAEINLNLLSKTTYNKGDVIHVSGYVRSAEQKTETLRIYLTCDNSQIQVLTRNINVVQNKDYPFSQDVTVPFSMSGSCQIQISFGTEQVNSETFTITKGLKGDFTLTPLTIQLGDEIKVKGKVTRLNGDFIDGSGTIYIEKDSQNFITSSIQVKDSLFEFKTNVENIPDGSYHVNVLVNDLFGNEEFFSNIAILNVYDKFKVASTLNKAQHKPGDNLVISGRVEKTVGTKIENAEVTIKIDGSEYSIDLVNNEFKYELSLSSTIKSYYHDVDIQVADSFGNKGGKTLKLYVIPDEIKLDFSIEKTLFSPKEIVTIKPLLYDQAEDLIIKSVLLTVLDSSNNKVIEREIPVNSEFSFKLNQFALPGTWTYKLKSDNLNTQNTFTVNAIEDVDIGLNGQTIIIKNIGNVIYTKPINIIANDQNSKSYQFSIRSSVSPNQETKFELYKALKSGVYDIFVDNTGTQFEKVRINDARSFFDKSGDFLKQATGSAIGLSGTSNNNKPLYYTLFVILLFALLVFIIRGRKKTKHEYVRSKEMQLGQKRLQQLKQEVPVEKRKSFGKATEADIKDFRARMVRDITTEKKPTIDIEDDGTVRRSIERNIQFDRFPRR